MFKSSTSIILTIVAGLYLASWGGMLPAEYTWAPFSALASWTIMDLFNFFKRERIRRDADAYGVEANKEETRGEAFKRKLEEGKKNGYQPKDDTEHDAVIRMINQDGEISSITFKVNGKMEVEGDPDPNVLEAARMLAGTVKELGPAAVAMEIARQIEIMNSTPYNEDDDE